MSCYRPVTCFKPLDGGPVSFHEIKNCREIQIRCGQCMGCRIDKRDAWAVRCYAESKMHVHNYFATFTYDNDHLPYGGSLEYRDFQLMLKRARKAFGPFRFFMSGEYGDNTKRAHYHALLFGCDLPNVVRYNSVYSRNPLYTSENICKVWGKGVVTLGEVTFESARYCATYVTKKITGKRAEEHYLHFDDRDGQFHLVKPEFARMSLKPGIGLEYLRKFYPDLYVTEHDAVVINGRKLRIPEYFDDQMKDLYPDIMEEALQRRTDKVNFDNSTRDRLAVREAVCLSKQKFFNEANPNAL